MAKDIDTDLKKGTGWFGKGGSVGTGGGKDDDAPVRPRLRRDRWANWARGIGGALLVLAIIAGIVYLWPFGFGGGDDTTKTATTAITTTRPDTTVAQDQATQVCVRNWRLSGRPVPADLELRCALEVAALYAPAPSPKGQSVMR